MKLRRPRRGRCAARRPARLPRRLRRRRLLELRRRPSVAPPGSPVFVEGTMRPTGELKANIDAIAEKVAGIDNLGEFIVSKLGKLGPRRRRTARLRKGSRALAGRRGRVFFEKLEDGNDFSGLGDPRRDHRHRRDAGIHRQAGRRRARTPTKDGSYEGVDYKVGDRTTTPSASSATSSSSPKATKAFKEAVDASKGESLAGETRYADGDLGRPDGSLADVYVDVGGLIEQSGGADRPAGAAGPPERRHRPQRSDRGGQRRAGLRPGRDRPQQRPRRRGSAERRRLELLGSLPGRLVRRASRVSGFGEQLEEAIDSLDDEGIPGRSRRTS